MLTRNISVLCLLFCFGLANCAGSPVARLSPSDRLSQSMPDGKHWTLANLNVEIPGSYCYDEDPSKCERCGRLYIWAAAQEACGSLGSFWRLPRSSPVKDRVPSSNAGRTPPSPTVRSTI